MKKGITLLGITILLVIILNLNIIIAASEDEAVLSTGIAPKITINQTGEKKNQTDPNADKNGNTNQPVNNTPTTSETNTNTNPQTTTETTTTSGGGGGGGSSSHSTTTNKSSTQEAGNVSVNIKVSGQDENTTQENISQESTPGITGAVVGNSLKDKLKIPFIFTIFILVIALIVLLTYKNRIKKFRYATP